jgi:hypothetical protein
MKKQTKQSPLSNNSNRKLRKVVPSKDKIEDNIQKTAQEQKSIMEKQTKEQEIMNRVSERFNLELDEEVALMLIKETRTQAISEFKEDINALLSCDDLTCYICRDRLEEMKARLDKTAQEIK